MPTQHTTRGIPLADRFWMKVRTGGRGCWEWTGSRWPGGYGRFMHSQARGVVKAHRLAYELAWGPIPEGLHVLHHRDNPACCRPTHLYAGTHRQNMADKVARGRAQASGASLRRGTTHHWRLHPERIPHGRQMGTAKLSDEAVLAMRHAYRAGARTKDLARQYGVGKSVAYKAIMGLTWCHVSDPVRLTESPGAMGRQE
jgi:uncharacterized protein YndB with AHSA1/START domain